MSLNQLLVATDLSSSSLHAVDRGILIASKVGAKYAILRALGWDALAPLREYLGAYAPAVSQSTSGAMQAEITRILEDPSRNRDIARIALRCARRRGQTGTEQSRCFRVMALILGCTPAISSCRNG